MSQCKLGQRRSYKVLASLADCNADLNVYEIFQLV